MLDGYDDGQETAPGRFCSFHVTTFAPDRLFTSTYHNATVLLEDLRTYGSFAIEMITRLSVTLTDLRIYSARIEANPDDGF
jgi:hypothetical protein